MRDAPAPTDRHADEDAQLAQGLCDGHHRALTTILERDYAVAALLAEITSGDAAGSLDAAWRRHLRGIVSGEHRTALRRELLRAVWDARSADPPEPPAPEPLGTFCPRGDRWEGWWDAAPPGWPVDFTPRPEHVVAALRRMPLPLRAVLVLRDVARLSAADSADVLDNDHLAQPELLQRSRDAYLVELDREVAGRG